MPAIYSKTDSVILPLPESEDGSFLFFKAFTISFSPELEKAQ